MEMTSASNPSTVTLLDAAGEARARSESIVTWLLETERMRGARSTLFLDSFARRLIDAGLPLDRLSMHIPQLHPQLAGRSLLWDREAGGATEVGYEHSIQNEQAYLASPIKVIYEGGEKLRRRLDGPDPQMDFPILEDLHERGFTDYVILPVRFSKGRVNALSLATRNPGGFKDLDLAILKEVLPAFSSLLELRQIHRTARDLISTYVGRSTGERIFSGAIQRGHGEVMHAIIWFCDLRDFTAMSQNQPLEEVIELLNTYFDCMAGPVTARGGEILKFVGDAMLAIFPCHADDATECGALGAALGAAQEAYGGITALSEVRKAMGQAPLDCGIAVHIGDVMYGNIGTADRLDFTVIGPAVNLVCRMEALTKTLDRRILVSPEIAHLAPDRFVSLGMHALKGMNEPCEVFALKKAARFTEST